MALNQDEASIGWIKGNAGKPSSEEQRTANGEQRTANRRNIAAPFLPTLANDGVSNLGWGRRGSALRSPFHPEGGSVELLSLTSRHI